MPDAFVAGYFSVDGNGSMLNQTFTRTDADGLTTIPLSTSDLQWKTQIRAAGFLRERFTLNLQPDEPVEVQLTPARPTTLRLTSGVDGTPVVDARGFVTKERTTRPANFTWLLNDPRERDTERYESREAPLYAYGPSDQTGRLVLDSLPDDRQFEILVMAPGFGPVGLHDLQAGQPEVDVQMFPELSITGTLTGDLTKLSTEGRRSVLKYRNPDRDSILTTYVNVRDGVGHFQIAGLGRGPVWIDLPERTFVAELTESLDDLVLNLNEPGKHHLQTLAEVTREMTLPPPRGRSRKVILTLTGATSDVPVTGKFRAGYLTRDEPDSYSSANLDIVDSKVEFDVEVPTKIHWVDRSFTGYSVVGRSEIEVDDGDEPFRLDIPLLPGGAVCGEVRLADGSLCRNFKVDLRPVDRKSKYKGAEEDVAPVDPPGEFVLTGVPFDQKFRLLVTDGRIKSVAAIVSEPFSLSAAEPIADLKFQFAEGQTHVIRLLDEDSQSAVGAKAEFAFNPGLGFVRSHGWKVNDDATVVFEHVCDSIPGETTFQINAAGPFRGQKLKLDWANLPKTLTLQRGLPAAGMIVDEATGRGVAGASFFLFPTPSTAAEFRDAVWGKTDEQGRFSFECLEPINYQLNLYGAVPPQVPFKANARGVLEPDYSGIKDGTFPEWFVKGGSSEPVSIQVKLTPGSRLKLTEPESGN